MRKSRWTTGSMTTAANFATSTTGFVDTGYKFAAGVIDTWANIGIKVNFKEKIYLNVYSTTHGVQTKLLTFFRRKIFSIGHWCQGHRWRTMSCEYIHKFSKKFETALTGYLWAWGKPIHDKKPEVENLVTLSL